MRCQIQRTFMKRMHKIEKNKKEYGKKQNKNNFILLIMELSMKSIGNNSIEKNSYIPNNYNSNKIRQYHHTNNKNRIQNSIFSSVVNTAKGYSLNKINLAQQNAKIDIIKLKCFKKLKPNSEKQSKQILMARDQEVDQFNISCDLEEETDDCILQKNQQKIIYMKASKFLGRPATVFFQYPKVCSIPNEIHNNNRIYPMPKIQMKYKINGWQYKCIINSLQFNGFKVCEEDNDWNIFFDIRGNKTKKIQYMDKFQKISHFPGCWYIGRKDFLWRGINKIRRSHPEQYNFVPLTYLLPGDFDRFQMARQNASKGQLWIMKPAAAACGRGIKMVAKDSKIRNRKQYLISQYVSNPHLINNLKYDLRVYVLVTSYDPLRIYLFEDGLVRFATHQYNCKHKDIKKRFVHLTNFSVNKHSKNFIKNDNADANNQGSKWSFIALRKYYESNGINSQKLFKSIEEVIIKTCISAQPNMLDIHSKSQQKRNCCFQLYGFDILIDDKLKPWLMEVNVCPSLSSSSPMDRRIKHTLLTDILNLIGIQHQSAKQQEKSKKILKDNFCLPQTGIKKIYSRNINTLEILNYQNCVQILSPEDWLVLLESEQQLDRLGNFKRIFPLKQNIHLYQNLFQFRRYYNIVLWKSLLSHKNFLQHIVKQ